MNKLVVKILQTHHWHGVNKPPKVKLEEGHAPSNDSTENTSSIINSRLQRKFEYFGFKTSSVDREHELRKRAFQWGFHFGSSRYRSMFSPQGTPQSWWCTTSEMHQFNVSRRCHHQSAKSNLMPQIWVRISPPEWAILEPKSSIFSESVAGKLHRRRPCLAFGWLAAKDSASPVTTTFLGGISTVTFFQVLQTCKTDLGEYNGNFIPRLFSEKTSKSQMLTTSHDTNISAGKHRQFWCGHQTSAIALFCKMNVWMLCVNFRWNHSHLHMWSWNGRGNLTARSLGLWFFDCHVSISVAHLTPATTNSCGVTHQL